MPALASGQIALALNARGELQPAPPPPPDLCWPSAGRDAADRCAARRGIQRAGGSQANPAAAAAGTSSQRGRPCQQWIGALRPRHCKRGAPTAPPTQGREPCLCMYLSGRWGGGSGGVEWWWRSSTSGPNVLASKTMGTTREADHSAQLLNQHGIGDIMQRGRRLSTPGCGLFFAQR